MPKRDSASPGDSADWDFGAGTEVTLTATPDAYSEFMGWDGLCDGDGPCTFVITEDVEPSLRFEPRATEKYMRHLANPEGRATDVHALDADQSGAVGSHSTAAKSTRRPSFLL